MQKDLKNIQEKDIHILFVVLAIILGGALRFIPPTLAGFPVHDGGMFYLMIEELKSNHFALPNFTAYNLSGIPFAYPPFGFYVAGIFSTLFKIPVVELLQWLPPIVSTVTLPIFYLMAVEILGSKKQAALSTLFYGLLPASYEWTIMGGGITRAFGLFFMFLTILFTNRLFSRADYKHAMLTALFGALAFLSHPQSGLQAALVSILLWIFRGRSKKTFFWSVLVVIGVVVLTSPWWGTILSFHGIAPFLSAMRISNGSLLYLISLLFSWLDTGPAISLTAAIGVTGLLATLAQKKFLLPVWLVLPFMVDPRTANGMGRVVAISMLAGYGFEMVLAPVLQHFRRAANRWYEDRFAVFTLFTIVLTLFIGSGLFGNRLALKSLPSGDRETIAWVDKNIPAGNNFLLLTGEQYSMNDPFQEWFPALTTQRSLTTLQGGEWTLAENFFPFYQKLVVLQNCSNPDCIHYWVEDTGLTFQYLLIKKIPEEHPYHLARTSLMESLRNSSRYKFLFENEHAILFLNVER